MEMKDFLQHAFTFLKSEGFSLQEIESRIRLIAIASKLKVEPRDELEQFIDLKLNKGLKGDQSLSGDGLPSKVRIKRNKTEPSEQKHFQEQPSSEAGPRQNLFQDSNKFQNNKQFQENKPAELNKYQKGTTTTTKELQIIKAKTTLDRTYTVTDQTQQVTPCGQNQISQTPMRKLTKKFKRNIYISGRKLDKCVLATGLERATILRWFREQRNQMPLTYENIHKSLKYIRKASPEARTQELADIRHRATRFMGELHHERQEINQLQGEVMDQMIETTKQETPPPETTDGALMEPLAIDWASAHRRQAAMSAQKAISSLYDYWDD